MAKQGKLFEELVALLETTLSGSALVVSKNARWIDLTTGLLREIDVAVGPKGGHPEEHIIFECRDRPRLQGVDWIEQIATKAKDVGAKHVVAVSKRGFQKGAQLKARAHGVELRTLNDIGLDAVMRWYSGAKVINVSDGIECNFEFIQVHSAAVLSGIERDERGVYTVPTDGFYVTDKDGNRVNPRDLYHAIPSPYREKVDEVLHKDEVVVTHRIRWRSPEPGDLQLQTPNGVAAIDWLILRLDRRREIIVSELVGAKSYVAEDGELGQVLTFIDAEGRMPFQLSRTSRPDDNGNVRIAAALPGLRDLIPPGANPDTLRKERAQKPKASQKRRKHQ